MMDLTKGTRARHAGHRPNEGRESATGLARDDRDRRTTVPLIRSLPGPSTALGMLPGFFPREPEHRTDTRGFQKYPSPINVALDSSPRPAAACPMCGQRQNAPGAEKAH